MIGVYEMRLPYILPPWYEGVESFRPQIEGFSSNNGIHKQP